jgi:molybdopterin converting factor small subunit
MSIKVNIHSTLAYYTNGQAVVEVDGSTVGQCLNELVKKLPETKKVLFDKGGGLHNYIEVYINQESAYPDELAKPVNDGDELDIFLILAGG